MPLSAHQKSSFGHEAVSVVSAKHNRYTNGMLLLVAMSAIIIPLLLLAVFRVPAKYGMTISALAVMSLAAIVWQMESGAIAASILQGTHRAVTILWILLGAVLLLNTLKTTGAMERIKAGFYTISQDMRVQVVLIGLLFVSLLEGLAGFGAPVAIAAPLLVSLGFRPMAAIVLTLVGDTIAVAFGAVGTPVMVGLSNVPSFGEPGFVHVIAQTITRIDVLIVTLLPLIMVTTLVFGFGENKKARSWRAVTEVLPWTLMVGVLYAVCSIVFAQVLTPEFVSIASASVVLAVAMVTAHRNILLEKDASWRTHRVASARKLDTGGAMSLVSAWLPYGFVLLALVATRLWAPAVAAVAKINLSWTNILGYETISSNWLVLASPGTILMLAALVAFAVRPSALPQAWQSLKDTSHVIRISVMALLPTLVMVQIFINSGINDSNLMGMPEYIARSFATIFGANWVFTSPFLGMLGAFITGSSTVSTLTMAPIQYSIALEAGLPTNLVLAQQVSGAAAGNMIAVHNIVAASAVVGIHHQEGHVIRRIAPVVVVYLVLGIAGALMVRFLGLV